MKIKVQYATDEWYLFRQIRSDSSRMVLVIFYTDTYQVITSSGKWYVEKDFKAGYFEGRETLYTFFTNPTLPLSVFKTYDMFIDHIEMIATALGRSYTDYADAIRVSNLFKVILANTTTPNFLPNQFQYLIVKATIDGFGDAKTNIEKWEKIERDAKNYQYGYQQVVEDFTAWARGITLTGQARIEERVEDVLLDPVNVLKASGWKLERIYEDCIATRRIATGFYIIITITIRGRQLIAFNHSNEFMMIMCEEWVKCFSIDREEYEENENDFYEEVTKYLVTNDMTPNYIRLESFKRMDRTPSYIQLESFIKNDGNVYTNKCFADFRKRFIVLYYNDFLPSDNVSDLTDYEKGYAFDYEGEITNKIAKKLVSLKDSINNLNKIIMIILILNTKPLIELPEARTLQALLQRLAAIKVSGEDRTIYDLLATNYYVPPLVGAGDLYIYDNTATVRTDPTWPPQLSRPRTKPTRIKYGLVSGERVVDKHGNIGTVKRSGKRNYSEEDFIEVDFGDDKIELHERGEFERVFNRDDRVFDREKKQMGTVMSDVGTSLVIKYDDNMERTIVDITERNSIDPLSVALIHTHPTP